MIWRRLAEFGMLIGPAGEKSDVIARAVAAGIALGIERKRSLRCTAETAKVTQIKPPRLMQHRCIPWPCCGDVSAGGPSLINGSYRAEAQAGCSCARATGARSNGIATALPVSVMNSRRLIALLRRRTAP